MQEELIPKFISSSSSVPGIGAAWGGFVVSTVATVTFSTSSFSLWISTAGRLDASVDVVDVDVGVVAAAFAAELLLFTVFDFFVVELLPEDKTIPVDWTVISESCFVKASEVCVSVERILEFDAVSPIALVSVEQVEDCKLSRSKMAALFKFTYAKPWRSSLNGQ